MPGSVIVDNPTSWLWSYKHGGMDVNHRLGCWEILTGAWVKQ